MSTSFGKDNVLSEKDRNYLLAHIPANPPANEECNDPRLMAADVVACENAKHRKCDNQPGYDG